MIAVNLFDSHSLNFVPLENNERHSFIVPDEIDNDKDAMSFIVDQCVEPFITPKDVEMLF